MLASMSDGIYLYLREGDLVAFFSIRLDEAGTDGLHDHAVVAGAVATLDQWSGAEAKWSDLLKRHDIAHYHDCDFQDRKHPYRDWGALKTQRFTARQEKIINTGTIFNIAVAVDRAAHTEAKKKLRGVRGFKADSDYGFALRIIMFEACRQLAQIAKEPRLQIVVEDGPWSSGAESIYRSVRGTEGSWKPSPHAHMLVGYNALPKGCLRGLEVADYLAGRAIRDIERGITKRPKRMFFSADAAFIAGWHDKVLEHKERRRAHRAKQISVPPASEGEPSS